MKIRTLVYVNFLLLVLLFTRLIFHPFIATYHTSLSIHRTVVATSPLKIKLDRLREIGAVIENNQSNSLVSNAWQRSDNVLFDVVNPNDPQPETSESSSKGDIVDRLKWTGSAKRKKEELLKENPRNCKPKRNIVFVKLHKCASSTIQNIIMRYGVKHDLTFALPSGKQHFFSLREPFSKRQGIMNMQIRKFNIFTHHAVFDAKEIRKVVADDAIFFTIIRDPSEMFESVFSYFRFPNLFGIENQKDPLATFLSSPTKFTKKRRKPSAHDQYIKNPMLFDLGYKFSSNNSITENDALNYIKYLDSIFDLVLVSDYFDESLILLKEQLCWSVEDIKYFTMNVRGQRSKLTIQDRHRKLMQRWNAADNLLYKYFNETFWEKINLFGYDNVKEEVLKLRQLNSKMQQTCILRALDHNDLVWHPEDVDIRSYKLKDAAKESGTCIQMTTTEKVFTEDIKRWQNSRFLGFNLY